MTAITIDKDKAIELLEKQVEKKGADYVYEFASCQYFADETGTMCNRDFVGRTPVELGQPLCIVGHVYADLGLTINDLYRASEDYDDEADEYTTQEIQDQGGNVMEVHPDPKKVVLTPDAEMVLNVAQEFQDTGYTWGAALDEAKDVAA